MTHTDINKEESLAEYIQKEFVELRDRRIHKEIDGGCWHGWMKVDENADHFTLYPSYIEICEICSERQPMGWKRPSYHTPEGTQKIKAWLIKEGEWLNFISFVAKKTYSDKYDMFTVATDPEQFALKFYEYIGLDDDKI